MICSYYSEIGSLLVVYLPQCLPNFRCCVKDRWLWQICCCVRSDSNVMTNCVSVSQLGWSQLRWFISFLKKVFISISAPTVLFYGQSSSENASILLHVCSMLQGSFKKFSLPVRNKACLTYLSIQAFFILSYIHMYYLNGMGQNSTFFTGI